MAVLSVVTIDRGGYDNDSAGANYASAAGGGDSFPNTGVEFVEVVNGGVGSITVTLDIQATVDSQAVTDRTVTVAASGRKIIGPFPTAVYNDANSRVNLSYSGVTSVKVAVRKLTTS